MALRTILRNVAANWAGYLVVSIAGFILSPIVVRSLGDAGYGVWTLVLSLTGYCGLLDLGIRSTVGRFAARYITLKDDEGVNRTIGTALAILFASSAAAMLVTLTLFWRFDSFQVDPVYRDSARWALLIAGLNVSLALPAGAFNAMLIALERFDIASSISVGGAVTRTALAIWALHSGHGIVTLALITLSVSLGEYSAAIVRVHTLYPALRIRVRYVDLSGLRELLSFGTYRFVWAIANQVIFYTDAVVIGYFVSAAAISPYAIAGSLITYGRTIVSLASDPLYPSAVRLDSENDRQGLRDLLIFGTQMSLLIGVPLCLGFVFLGRQFLRLWMGPGHDASAIYLMVLTIPQLTSFAQYPASLIMAGMARHKMLAYIAVGEGIANLTLSVVLVREMGAMGVAWGTVFPHLVTTMLVMPAYALRSLGMSPGHYVRAAFLKPLLCGIPVAGLCYFFATRFETTGLPLFGAEVLAVTGAYAVLAYSFCLSAEQKARISGKLRMALNLEPVNV